MKAETGYDVIVIGAGPAGIAAATHAMHRGKKVLLLAQKPDTCSALQAGIIESIAPGVISLLQFLKINTSFTHVVAGTYSYIANEQDEKSLNPFTHETWQGFHVYKEQFVSYFEQQALKQGLTVLHNNSVEQVITEKDRVVGIITNRNQVIKAKYIIDASGKKCVLGKKLSMHQQYYSPALICFTGRGTTSNSIFGSGNKAWFMNENSGWTWIGKLSDGSFYFSSLNLSSKSKIAIPSLFESGTVQHVADMRWRIFNRLSLPGALLCGEAAMVIDPASGQGIFNALSSGIKAADTAVACIDKPGAAGNLLFNYEAWMKLMFAQKVAQLGQYYDRLAPQNM
jgi:flavin-dependent dehydrogenase